MKKNTARIYTETLSLRLTPAEAKRVFELSLAGRRTVSQTLRMLLEPALEGVQPSPARGSSMS
jgi:hypothetical protein